MFLSQSTDEWLEHYAAAFKTVQRCHVYIVYMCANVQKFVWVGMHCRGAKKRGPTKCITECFFS